MIIWGIFVSFDIYKSTEEEIAYGKWDVIVGLYQ